MFSRLGRLVPRFRWWIVGLWAIVVVVSLPLAPRLTTVLKPGGFGSESVESARALRIAEERLGHERSSLVAVFQSPSLTADDPRFQGAIDRALAASRAQPGVRQVISPDLNPRQISDDGHTAYAVISLRAPAQDFSTLLAEMEQGLGGEDVTLLLSGAPVFYADIEEVSARDLRRAELVAFPIGLLALLLVMRSAVAAAVPVAVGGAGVAVALAMLFAMGRVVDLSVFVMNMTTMLGLGLSIDYALFVTSRFREELLRREPDEAIVAAVATAGRAIFFSAVTVLTGLLGLTTFDSMVLRSLGIGGVIVVCIAALAALTLLPALLAILGRRINALALPAFPAARSFSWARLAQTVMLHPVAFALPVLALLVLSGWPFLGVRLNAPDASILPAEMSSRRGFEALRREFGEGDLAPIMVVVQSKGEILLPSNLGALYDFTHRLAQDPRVARVDSIVDLDPRLTREQYQLLYADPEGIADPYARAALAGMASGDTTIVAVASKHPMIAVESQDLVRSIRGGTVPNGFEIVVGGGPAAILDYVANLYFDLPRAIALMVITTYLALFFLFRSVVLPLKAIIMNALSIAASYGALVAVFQEGHLSSLLGFEPVGFVEASLPIVMFCFLFGVSMDYEVFLLSRIKEAYDRTGDNTLAVAEGLERSGRVITSAALIVVVVAASFVAADIILIKSLGFGTALAVFLDATIVRALLVPATMRLLGGLNWWLPARADLRRIVARRAILRYALPALAACAAGAGLLWGGPAQTPPTNAAIEGSRTGIASALPPTGAPLRPISLPSDDAPHENLTEWWYYTGHLGAADGSSYGFEYVVFQSRRGSAPVGYAAHFAITDLARRTFRFDQRSEVGEQRNQPPNGFALRVGDWEMSGGDGRDRLAAKMKGYGLDLTLESRKPPALHLGNGIVSFGPAGDSYYYSRTRMAASGTLARDGVAQPVSGEAWMDHQWGDFLVLNKGGWDWFALQLSDGSDLTLSLVRDEAGQVVLQYGTYVAPDGQARHIPADGLGVRATGTWTSPRSGGVYPADWRIAVNDLGLSLTVVPLLADQELDTRATTGVVYWEGAVDVTGEIAGRPVGGRGYVELTGYAQKL